MRREFSAGGVLIRRVGGAWMVAVMRPAGSRPGVWVLPKGHIDRGETAQGAALREVAEETGLRGRTLAPLGEIAYWYTSEGERVLKTVAFFLLAYRSGTIGRLPQAFRHEVAEARWLALAEAPTRLAFPGERRVAANAREMVENGQHV